MVQAHCLSTRGVMLDQCWANVDDLTEVMPGPEDWRNWALHASDELGQEILVMPFSSVLGWRTACRTRNRCGYRVTYAFGSMRPRRFGITTLKYFQFLST